MKQIDLSLVYIDAFHLRWHDIIKNEQTSKCSKLIDTMREYNITNLHL